MRLLCSIALAATAIAAQTFSGGPAIDRVIDDAIAQGKLPGAVVIIGHEGKIAYRKAYGRRAVVPEPEAMTDDTIFDLASITKVVATTTALMQLFEQGKLRLNDKVTDYIPEFQGGKSGITLRNLFTHFSGLKPDVPLANPWSGYQTGIKLACTDPPDGPPGARFVYSDINFILLGELVHRLSGQTLSDYARDHIFQPLGMQDTMFQPPAALAPRIAPTERVTNDSPPLRGVVHDPTARNMGGVAGHAGVFSTARDLARFAQMMLNGGELDGVRIVSAATIQKFTEPQTPPDQPILRGLGWDIDSPYSGNRGELFPIGSFGHTGFTGTSLWIDPNTQTYVILLANSVHPTGHPSLTALRGKVATIAAAAVGIETRGLTLTGYSETFTAAGVHREVGRNAATRSGLDVLAERNFQPLAGQRNVDLMRRAGITIAALFSPEHGFAGREDQPEVRDATDAATGIRIYSLYGATARPTPEMLRGVDALVFDIQDIGARFWTYETTLAYAMEAAAHAGIPFYVLDRPNPITGTHVEGPLLDADRTAFVGYIPGLPVRHGMTIGELARLVNGEKKIGAALTVIPLEDWRRGDWFDSTNLPWVNPSPNMRGAALSGAVLAGGREEFFGGPRHRRAVRASGRGLHRRPRAGRLAELAPDPRRARVSHQLHAYRIELPRRAD